MGIIGDIDIYPYNRPWFEPKCVIDRITNFPFYEVVINDTHQQTLVCNVLSKHADLSATNVL